MAITRSISRPSGTVVEDITGAELTEFEEMREAISVKEQATVDAIAQFTTDKASAKAKLIAGEALTEAEADTLTG